LLRVEIVTPVHNRKALTLQCLRSLSKINGVGLTIHTIILDDGSTDGTAEEISRLFPEVEIIRGDGNLWYAGGTNLGIERALKNHPDYILAINDDTIFHESFLQRLIKCSERNPKSIIGALLLLWDRPHAVFQVGARWDTWYGGWRHSSNYTAWTVPQEAFEVEHIVGNCVLYPVAAILQNGLMNHSKLPHLTADIEYTIRMRRSGWRLLIEPSAYVWCQPNIIKPPIGTLNIRSILRELLFDVNNQRNLVQLFKTRWYSAPSRYQALAASFIFFVRLALHVIGLGGRWPFWEDLSVSAEFDSR
jgi:GT2 family glycosyltransferase